MPRDDNGEGSPLIQFKDVTFSYADNEETRAPALCGCSFSIFPGEFVALVGHNSSGKSTLAKLSNGLIRPNFGEVISVDRSTADEKVLVDIRENIGLVFQNPDNQAVATIVEDDVAFGPENLNLPQTEIRERVDQALEAVDMTNRNTSILANLSGGQKQLVAIAGVLALRPRMIILDEATSLLDPKGRKKVLKQIMNLNQRGIGIVMITHRMEEVLLAGRVIALEKGSVIFDGTPDDLFVDRELLVRAGLEPPPIIDLVRELNSMNHLVNIPKNPAQLVEEICALR
jgi:energy-coupling factor transport system ATP-binding protein